MFRSSTIIREPALNLAKVTFMLKHSVKLRRYLLCGCVAACHGMALCVVCCAECDDMRPSIIKHSLFGTVTLESRSQKSGNL
jgi:hypothetical protein